MRPPPKHVRLFLTVLTLGLFACAGAAPLMLDSASPRPVEQVRECVVERLEGRGYSITSAAADTGAVRAERLYQRPDTIALIGTETVQTLIEWSHLEVSFRQTGDSTSIRYVAATTEDRDGPWGEPSPLVARDAEEIAESCR